MTDSRTPIQKLIENVVTNGSGYFSAETKVDREQKAINASYGIRELIDGIDVVLKVREIYAKVGMRCPV